VGPVEPAVNDGTVTLDCDELTTRQINQTLRGLPPGSRARILNPRGRHSLAVGLLHHLDITIDGDVGHYAGGLCAGPDIRIGGFAGWAAGENLMRGTIRIAGNASERVGASAHGGTIVVDGDASTRAAISLKGGTVLVAGDVGNFSAFMAQAGVLLVGGDAGEALGDSLYEAVVYVAGAIKSLGSDAQVEELTERDVARVQELLDIGGFSHVSPEDVTRVGSARQLYNFDAVKAHNY
jgi:methylamine---glutamate N-methyltransferase subunit B